MASNPQDSSNLPLENETLTQGKVPLDDYLKKYLEQKKVSQAGITVTGYETIPATITGGEILTPIEINSRIKIKEAEALSGIKIKEIEAEATRKIKEIEVATEKRLKFLNFLVKDISVLVIAILLVLILMIISTFTFFNSNASQENKDWAKATLTAIGGAVAGYLFGKGSAP